MEVIVYKDLLNQVNKEVVEIEPDDHCQVISGVLSDALYLNIAGNNLKDQDLIERSYKLIDYHLETAENYILNYKWAHGITGLGWMIAALCNNGLLSKDTLGEIDQLDEYIGKSLLYDFEIQSYDFSVGALGKAHYFLERNNEIANSYLAETVDYLNNSAIIYNENECFWFDYYTIEKPTDLLINFGLFHGHSSIVYFLSKIYNAGISVEKCENILNKSINFLERIYNNYDQDIPNGLLFDEVNKTFKFYQVDFDIQGWCHGLLSNALAFYIAGKTLRNNKWIEIFRSLISKVCDFELEKVEFLNNNEPTFYLKDRNGRIDTTFCHGLIGHIYMLDKIYKVMPEDCLKKSSKYWENILMEYSLPNKIIPKDYFYHKGMIAGKSGLGLYLMQKLRMDTSILDKLFLLDLDSFAQK